MGKLDAVEAPLQQALGIYRTKFGDAHPTTAAIHHNLGSYYRVAGQLDRAAAELNTALATRATVLGTSHPDYLDTQEALALVAWQAGRTAEATPAFRQLNATNLKNAQRFFAALSEPEKARYWAQLRPRFERFTNYAVANAAADATLAADAYDLQLATKAMLLSSSTQLRERILGGSDAQLIALYQAWQRASEQLAYAYTLTQEDLTEAGLRPDSIERSRNAIEKQLAAKSADFAGAVGGAAPSWRQVAAALAPAEAAVEIVRVRTWQVRFTGGVSYAALVLKAGSAPTAVVNAAGEALEGRALTRYRRAIKNKSDDAEAYAAYWQWLAPALAGVTTAYVAPDAVYNQVSLPTLRSPEGKYVLELLSLRTLVSTRDLPGVKAARPATARTATLVGAADFGAVGASSGSTERAIETTIEPLPGTLTEVTRISALLKASGWAPTVLTAAQATEARVKSAPAPRLLHIATHGFFLPDVAGQSLVFGVAPERAAENPLLRSGLLLTGAERAVQQIAGVAPQPGDNGVLTAFEALTLNLRGTDLVVLSACETGLGQVQAGEGVYGLQRAIQLAGARALVFSLWRVDDAASQELMTGFYRYWLAGRPLAAAFRQAQLDLKAKYPQPYYWGAFVLIGA
jgi:CHAT domain-containing protein